MEFLSLIIRKKNDICICDFNLYCQINSFFILYFFKLLVMNNFTIFHIIILCTINTLIVSIVDLIISPSSNYEIIMIIITFLIEILSVFIFLEIIELNFCGLNHNLRKNIISRSIDEDKLIYEINDDADEVDDNSENDLPNNKEKIVDDDNSEY